MHAHRQIERERLQTGQSYDHQVKRRQPNQRARRAPPDSYCSWEKKKKSLEGSAGAVSPPPPHSRCSVRRHGSCGAGRQPSWAFQNEAGWCELKRPAIAGATVATLELFTKAGIQMRLARLQVAVA